MDPGEAAARQSSEHRGFNAENRDCATTKTRGLSNSMFEDSGLRWFKQQEYELLIKDGLSQ